MHRRSHNFHSSPRKKQKSFHDSRFPSATMTNGSHDDVQLVAGIQQDEQAKELQHHITEYIHADIPSFSGLLKKRYTDFQVNEILPNGEVAHLGELVDPAAPKPPKKATPELEPSNTQTLQKPLGEPQPQQINAFPNTGAFSPSSHAADASEAPVSTEANSRPVTPTPMNRFDKGNRTKEKFTMQYSGTGGDTITISKAGDPTPASIADNTASVPDQARSNSAASPTKPSDKSIAPPTSFADQLGVSTTVAGWNAFADEKAKAAEPASTASRQTTSPTKTQSGVNQVAFTLSERDRTLLLAYFDAATVERILKLHGQVIAKPDGPRHEFNWVQSKPIDRETRGEAHGIIRRIFASRLESTANHNGVMVIAPKVASSRPNPQPGQVSNKSSWKALGGEYLHFSMYKQGKGGDDILGYLARTCGVPRKNFQVAGTKDRRAASIQRVSAYHLPAKTLIGAATSLYTAVIGNLQYHPQQLELGDLLGNEFTITLRDCHFKDEAAIEEEFKLEWLSLIVQNAAAKLKKHGFLNYFGLQRFGTFETGTHVIGRLLLLDDLKGACDAILAYDLDVLSIDQAESHRESQDIRARAHALRIFATTGNSREALQELPKRFGPEYSIIQHLGNRNQQNDYHGALMSMWRRQRDLYTHAYQSFVWNHVASVRWQKYGNKVVPGDLVLCKEHPESMAPAEAGATQPALDQDGEPIIEPESTDATASSDERFVRARVVTESELQASDCKISIFDIVLPSPGYDIIYPTNDMGAVYKDFMASEEGGGLDPHKMRRKWNELSLSGDYRKVLARPLGDVEVQVKRYGSKGDDEQFVETDLDRLEKQHAAAANSPSNATAAGAQATTAAKTPEKSNTATINGASPEDASSKQKKSIYSSQDIRSEDPFSSVWQSARGSPNTKPGTDAIPAPAPGPATETPKDGVAAGTEGNNDKIAVILKFQLGSSVYATMALREMMKKGGVKTWRTEYSRS
ncbi:MAG: hypothetical protein Q9174_003671 [Haloplaca sp. 1 TL-2023]